MDPIHNLKEENSGWAGISSVAAASLRFQTPRDAILQHLEKFYPSVFTQKLMVDFFIAIAIEQLVSTKVSPGQRTSFQRLALVSC
jgi:hypothetical protein